MQQQNIESKKAPKVVGPYSQAIKIGDFLFCSGQIGIDPKINALVKGGIEKETQQVFKNLEEVLKEGGADFDSVLKMTVYLANMDDYSVMNELYATFFHKPYPARATVAVARLPKDALIEIECIAYIKKREGCGAGCCSDC